MKHSSELTPQQLLVAYNAGQNISQLLREVSDADGNSESTVELAYDLQAGSYVAAMQDPDFAKVKKPYNAAVAGILRPLFDGSTTLLEVGVGEATTLSGVLSEIGRTDVEAFGFDISWSRVKFASEWLSQNGKRDLVSLCTGSLLRAPFADASVDVVYTSHSIEPNGGNEAPILEELLRITRKHLVLFEPGFELASEKARARMESHGYCKDLPRVATSLGHAPIEHRLLEESINPLNPTAVTIISKTEEPPDQGGHSAFACPRYRTPLIRVENVMHAPDSLLVYPIVDEIPCLRVEHGIVASKFK